MKKQELNACLQHELETWTGKSCDTLRNELRDVVTYSGELRGAKYSVEVLLLEDRPGSVHVGLSMDDGRLFRAMFPVSTSFLVHADARVEN